MQTARIAVLIAAASLAVVCPAAAQDARARQAAAEAYDQGTAAYLAGDYEKAAQWFETANRLAPAAPALIQAARSLQEAGLPARAATIALRLTSEYANEPAAVQYGQDILDRLTGQLVRVDVNCDGCTIDVDGTLQEWPSFFVSPDERHIVTASFETGDRTAEVTAGAGETRTLQFAAPPPQPGGEHGGSGARSGELTGGGEFVDREDKPLPPLYTFVGAGLTVALAGASVISTLDMNSGVDGFEEAAREYNAACKPPAPGSMVDCDALYEDAKRKLDDGEAKETRSTVLWIATGAVGAATLAVALFLTDWSGEGEPSAQRRLDFALVPGKHDASLVMKGTF